MTSPYDFFQYWLNDDDALVVQHLHWLTLMTEPTRSDEIEEQHREGAREAACPARARV